VAFQGSGYGCIRDLTRPCLAPPCWKFGRGWCRSRLFGLGSAAAGGKQATLQQMGKVSVVVRSGAPLVEGDDHLGGCVLGYFPRCSGGREMGEEVTQCHCQFAVALFEPCKVRGQHFEGDELVAQDQRVTGPPQLTNRPQLAKVVQQIAELGEVGRPCILWKDPMGHLERLVQHLGAVDQQATYKRVMVGNARAAAQEGDADGRIEQDPTQETVQRIGKRLFQPAQLMKAGRAASGQQLRGSSAVALLRWSGFTGVRACTLICACP